VAIKTKLEQIVSPNQIIDNPEVLKEYSEDHSFIPPQLPSLIVTAKENKEVKKIIKLANKEKFSLIPISSGLPRFHGDTIPSKEGLVILNLQDLNSIIFINRKNRVCAIEAGGTFSQLIPQLEKKKMRIPMPLCPKASKSAVASFWEREPKTLARYQWELCDPLSSAEIILGNGDTIWEGEIGYLGGSPETQRKRGFTHKSPSGANNMNFKKFGASQGTLGVCTWGSIRCELMPECEQLFVVSGTDLKNLTDIAHKLMWLRLADDIFILNALNLASLLKQNPEDILSLSETLPKYLLIFTITGAGVLPEEMLEYKQKEVEEHNIPAQDSVEGVSQKEIQALLRRPSKEPYWRLRLKGDSRDLAFQTSLAKTGEFVNEMEKIIAEFEYPATELGIYIQPEFQGVCCNLEFTFNMDQSEADTVRNIIQTAGNQMFSRGAFFNRPYGEIADLVYSHYPTTKTILQYVKEIFDPNGVMSPGRLCFKEVVE